MPRTKADSTKDDSKPAAQVKPAEPAEPAQGKPAQAARLDVPGAPAAQPAAQGAPTGRLTIPGAPRNYQTEQKTEAQANAELGPSHFAYPIPAPMHGLAGFTQLAGWAAQELTGGEQPPEEIIGDQKDALLVLISNCKWLALGKVIQNAIVAHHADYGNFHLRAVERPGGGYLIGIVDDAGACYGAPEWYEDLPNTADAWKDWVRVCNQ
jgi:hypothetical protein